MNTGTVFREGSPVNTFYDHMDVWVSIILILCAFILAGLALYLGHSDLPTSMIVSLMLGYGLGMFSNRKR